MIGSTPILSDKVMNIEERIKTLEDEKKQIKDLLTKIGPTFHPKRDLEIIKWTSKYVHEYKDYLESVAHDEASGLENHQM